MAALVSLAIFCLPLPAMALETAVLAVTLNLEAKGDCFVKLNEQGDIFVKRADLERMGLGGLAGEAATLEGNRTSP